MTRRTAAGRTAADKGGPRATAGAARPPDHRRRGPRPAPRPPPQPRGRARRLTLVALAACAAIPVSGDVRSGQSIKDESVSGVELRPDGPPAARTRPPCSAASSRRRPAHRTTTATAREFLSSASRRSGTRGRGVTISDGQRAGRARRCERADVHADRERLGRRGRRVHAGRPPDHLDADVPVRPGGDTTGASRTPPTASSCRRALPFGVPAAWRLLLRPDRRLPRPDVRWFLAQSSVATQGRQRAPRRPGGLARRRGGLRVPEGHPTVAQRRDDRERHRAGRPLERRPPSQHGRPGPDARTTREVARHVASVLVGDVDGRGREPVRPVERVVGRAAEPRTSTHGPSSRPAARSGYAAGTGSVSALGGGMSQQIVALDPDAVA